MENMEFCNSAVVIATSNGSHIALSQHLLSLLSRHVGLYSDQCVCVCVCDRTADDIRSQSGRRESLRQLFSRLRSRDM